MSYTVTDRRRPELFDTLPVENPVVASDFSQRPVAQVDADVDVYDPPKNEEKQYDLSPLRLHYGEFLRYHARAKEANGWLKTFKSLLPGVVGDASLMVMGNLPVATFRRDQKLSMKRLADEQPQIIAKYTRRVVKEEFDEEAFRNEEPLMHQAYRGRSFRLVASGPGAGLVLPS